MQKYAVHSEIGFLLNSGWYRKGLIEFIFLLILAFSNTQFKTNICNGPKATW